MSSRLQKYRAGVHAAAESEAKVNAMYASLFGTDLGRKVLDHLIGSEIVRPTVQGSDALLRENEGRRQLACLIVQRAESGGT